MLKNDKPLECGVRQVAISADGIDLAHVQRYQWAAAKMEGFQRVPPEIYVWDIGCGCGYGGDILTRPGVAYLGIDHSQEAIDFAKDAYGPVSAFMVGDVTRMGAPDPLGKPNALVALEIIEHIPDHEAAMKCWRSVIELGGQLLISIPRDCPPVGIHEYHVKDWVLEELVTALKAAGFKPRSAEEQSRAGSFGPIGTDPARCKAICVEARAV